MISGSDFLPVAEATVTDCRAVSITLNYILALGIAALLVTGLLIAGGGFVQDQREHVMEGEMNVIANHVANNLESVDRFVNASADDDPDVAYINETFQRQVTGSSYTITLEENPDQVVVSSARPDVTVRVNATVRTGLDEGSFAGGGTVSVAYEDGQLVVRNA